MINYAPRALFEYPDSALRMPKATKIDDEQAAE
eukprot:CAMPEP_0116874750 /NCGR_PEP_ID=MMETSP0463-20121206/6313_1 /TAXON_ID=181622 /ORGANISM="Strombidinopsis sp, Strain SopsisLIS2011" /LENGTH=32 /DNA_ID= /DNA_START= /DNA_END= /DNA_ORIENTATION=